MGVRLDLWESCELLSSLLLDSPFEMLNIWGSAGVHGSARGLVAAASKLEDEAVDFLGSNSGELSEKSESSDLRFGAGLKPSPVDTLG